MNKNILKTLTDSLDIDDETLSEITSDTILFGPMSKMGFDSIDAMAYISGLRRDFDIPVETNIGLNQIITLSETEKWLTESKLI